MWQYYLMKAISKIVCILPDFLKEKLGIFLGQVFWFVTPRWRKDLATGQVRECLSLEQPEARRIAKASVLKFGPMMVEVLCFPLLNKENIKQKVSFPQLHSFKNLFQDGKGIILATAHFDNWELFGAALALYDIPIVAVAKKQKQLGMDRFINEYRSMVGEHVTYKTGVLEMARMLDQGYAIGLLADQDGGEAGVAVDFFGRPTSCPKGAATLARMRGVPLVLVLTYTHPDGRRDIVFRPPINVERSHDREKDVQQATQALMKDLEDEIRKQPEMWFWLHNRWKASSILQEKH